MKKCEVINVSTRKKTFIKNLITYGVVILAFVICEALISQKQMSRSLRGQLVPICCYIVMAVSLNLTVGISGELSLGHAGFMSIGAFSGVIFACWLKATQTGMSDSVRLLLSIIVGGILAGMVGTLIGIPVLRLRGDYLAIVTLAFSEIIRNVLNLVFFSLDGSTLYASFNNPRLPGKFVFNGPAGTQSITKIATFEAGFLLVLFTLFVVLNLINSQSGRAIMAARDNRIAAESTGISVTRYKMMAFVTSAILAGMAGALFGLNYSTLQASKFNVDASIQVLVFVVLGGLGNILGSVISATVLYILPEMLREFSQYRMLIYAVILILVMVLGNNPRLKGWAGAVTENINRIVRRKGKVRNE